LKRANGERRAGDFAEFAHEVWVLPLNAIRNLIKVGTAPRTEASGRSWGAFSESANHRGFVDSMLSAQ